MSAKRTEKLDPDLHRAINSYISGLSYEAAARKHGVCRTKLYNTMKRLGYRSRSNATAGGFKELTIPEWMLDLHPKHTPAEIARLADCSRIAVVNHLKKRGTWQPRPPGADEKSRWSNSTKNRELVLKAIEMRERGLTSGQIAIKLGKPRSTITGWWRRYDQGVFLWQQKSD